MIITWSPEWSTGGSASTSTGNLPTDVRQRYNSVVSVLIPRHRLTLTSSIWPRTRKGIAG
jgi:hypothetical protein